MSTGVYLKPTGDAGDRPPPPGPAVRRATEIGRRIIFAAVKEKVSLWPDMTAADDALVDYLVGDLLSTLERPSLRPALAALTSDE